MFEALVRSLRDDGFTVRQIEYGGQGEPLTHPEMRKIVGLARSYLPETLQRIVTSGNFDYEKTLAGVAVDHFYISCDGVHQHSYERYRVNGNVDRVFRFMSEIPKTVAGRTQNVTWKYILFEFNDSDSEIREAQDIARDLDVDLMFVLTHSLYASQRYTVRNKNEFPIFYENVQLAPTPPHTIDHHPLVPNIEAGWPVNRYGRQLFMIDDLAVVGKRELLVQGWTLSEPGTRIDKVCIRHNGDIVGEAKLRKRRSGVYNEHPEFNDKNSGFELDWCAKDDLDGPQTIEGILYCGNEELARFARVYHLQKDRVQTLISTDEADWWPLRGSENVILMFDKVVVADGLQFEALGWVFCKDNNVVSLELEHNGALVTYGNLGLHRPAVAQAFPECTNLHPGFSCQWQSLSRPTDGIHQLKTRIFSEGGLLAEIRREFRE
jgi:hypothetical protein